MLELKNIQTGERMTKKQTRLALCAAVIAIVAIIATIVGCGGNGNPGGGDRFTTFTLTTGAEPAIGGTVSREPHATNYQNGTAVTLTVTPATGYQFVGWSDESVPAISPTTITIVRNTALTALFEPIPIDHHTLTVNASPAVGGMVSRDPDAATYPHGTEVTVTATPTEGYTFINWSGASTSTNAEVKITVNGNMTLTANFELIGANVHTLIVNTNLPAGGTVSRNRDAPSYTHGTEVTVTAAPAEGYTFTNWSGATTSTNAEVRVTMNANLTLTANFLQIPSNHHTLVTQMTPDNGGIIHINNVLSTGITTHDHGVSVNISATADPGFRFINWTMTSGTATFGNANSESTTITLTSNMIIRANFMPTYILTIDPNPEAGGTVTPASGQNYDANTPVSITATAASGYRFVNWTVTSGTATFGNADSENTTVTLTSNTIIRANFMQMYILTIDQNPIVGGTFTPASGQSHDANTAVSITAAAASGYRFVNWEVTSGTATFANASSANTTVTLSSNTTIRANFQRTFTLAINRDPTAGGSVTPASALSHDSGAVVNITATAASDHRFVNWEVTSGTATFASANDAATTVILGSNTTITANFQRTFTLTITQNLTAGGTFTPASGQNYDANTPVNISATAASGHRFINWTVMSGTATFANANDTVTTVTLSSNATIRANFGHQPTDPNIEMILVEGGTFTMGCTPEQGNGCWGNESPTHQVTLTNGYYIGKYPVTQAQWVAVMGSNPSNFNGNLSRPVETVSWNEIQTFITALNTLTGRTYRLPTEAEWEFAARGGNGSLGYKYSGSDNIGNVAWYWNNSGSTTHPVGTKSSNELGLFDMSGNVWEWVHDWYGSYTSTAKTNPTGPSSGSDRVVRGGSWDSVAGFCRVSDRGGNAPGNRNDDLGFRLALSPPLSSPKRGAER
jgi:uncharacterized repeat protein (TIGR02543 family)